MTTVALFTTPHEGETVESFAARLVDGSRSDDHACMATMNLLRENANKGNIEAAKTLRAVQEYIAAHPVVPAEIPMKDIDEKVMARLRAPFTCEFISSRNLGPTDALGRWRIADANDDAVASCAAAEEGYARLIVQALNEHFERRNVPPSGILKCKDDTVVLTATVYRRLLQVIGDEWGGLDPEEKLVQRFSDDGWFAKQLAEDAREGSE